MSKLEELTEELIEKNLKIEDCRKVKKQFDDESMKLHELQNELQNEIPEIIKKIKIETDKEE